MQVKEVNSSTYVKVKDVVGASEAFEGIDVLI